MDGNERARLIRILRKNAKAMKTSRRDDRTRMQKAEDAGQLRLPLEPPLAERE